ncbi:MAG TPA: carbon monoxide dehydrogenase subunit G [Thermoplasmata archaeon]|nr:carbon monoxide dehydrogenase subunit G [Thermoplasmata archaeon]
MHIEGDFRVRAAASRVYAFFLDPVAFTDCLDDPHEFHAIDADHFEGTVTTGVAFIRGTFRVRGSYLAKTPTTAVRVRLQGAGLGSGVDADLELALSEAAGETALHWQGEVHLSGPVATLGERMVRGTVDKKAASLFENARRKIESG